MGTFMFNRVEMPGDLVNAGWVADGEDDVADFVREEVEMVDCSAVIKDKFRFCDFGHKKLIVRNPAKEVRPYNLTWSNIQ